MKMAIGWLASWALYLMGDIASRLLRAPESWPYWWFDAWYAVYNRLMVKSVGVQRWGGAGPWGSD